MKYETTSYLCLPGQRMASMENPNISLSDPAAWADLFDEDAPADAGIKVSRATSLKYGAVWRGVGLLSDTVAKLSLYVYEKSGLNKELAPQHPAYYLLARKPNIEMVPFVWKRLLMFQQILDGNHYSYVWRQRNGDPVELIPLVPDNTWPERRNGTTWYRTVIATGDNQFATRWLPPEDVIHVKGQSEDGLIGMKWWAKAKESIGLGMALRKFAAKFFENGARASGVLMYPGRLTPEAERNLMNSFESKQSGLTKAHKTILLEEGTKYQQLTVPNNEAQFNETRLAERGEMALWLGVPPHKLGDSTRAAYNTLEQENQSFLSDTIDAHLVNIEQEVADKLLTEREQRDDTHYVAFDRSGLVRADMNARYSAYSSAVGGPFMMADEARAAENMNPLPNEEGKVLLRPVNMQAVGQTVAGDVAPADGTITASPDAVQAIAADAVGRALRRVVNETKAAAGKPATFAKFLDEMPARFTAGMVQAIAPVAHLCGKRDGWAAEKTNGLIEAFVRSLASAKSEADAETYFANVIIPIEAAFVREIMDRSK